LLLSVTNFFNVARHNFIVVRHSLIDVGRLISRNREGQKKSSFVLTMLFTTAATQKETFYMLSNIQHVVVQHKIFVWRKLRFKATSPETCCR
jgi:hypothetical protein